MNRSSYSPFENLFALWKEEDDLIAWAINILEQRGYVGDHLEVIETYMDCVDLMRQKGEKTERHTSLIGLFMRTFDAMGHGLRAAMSGNYAGCAMYARDLIETCFLLDYLMSKPGEPERWLAAPADTVRRDYKAIDIRKFLDDRDGFSSMKRASHFQMLSALGAHPTPQAFALRRDGTKSIRSGPFKHKEMLIECVQELAKAALLLGEQLKNFSNEFPDGASTTSRLALVQQRIHERYFQKSDPSRSGT